MGEAGRGIARLGRYLKDAVGVALDISGTDFREANIHVTLGIHAECELIRLPRVGVRRDGAAHQGIDLETGVREVPASLLSALGPQVAKARNRRIGFAAAITIGG